MITETGLRVKRYDQPETMPTSSPHTLRRQRRNEGRGVRAPTAPGGFAPTKAAVFNCRPSHAPCPRRGHRPWVESARNARQLKVAGFTRQAPWRGCVEPPPAVSPHEGRDFQLPAAPSPIALRPSHPSHLSPSLHFGRGNHPRVEIAQNARQLKVAGFVCKAP